MENQNNPKRITGLGKLAVTGLAALVSPFIIAGCDAISRRAEINKRCSCPRLIAYDRNGSIREVYKSLENKKTYEEGLKIYREGKASGGIGATEEEIAENYKWIILKDGKLSEIDKAAIGEQLRKLLSEK